MPIRMDDETLPNNLHNFDRFNSLPVRISGSVPRPRLQNLQEVFEPFYYSPTETYQDFVPLSPVQQSFATHFYVDDQALYGFSDGYAEVPIYAQILSGISFIKKECKKKDF